MLHIVPILCLVFYILYIELQTKKEMHRIEEEFLDLKRKILNNKNNIEMNRILIDNNKNKIEELSNG